MPLRFTFALHDHQPVGNFDSVFDQAYRDGYEPFLSLAERFPAIKFTLHHSGCLLEWLVAHRPEYVARVRRLVQDGQVEILGGAYFEPILSMIPHWDRQGQITSFTDYVVDLFGCSIRGLWLAERVWEPELVSDLNQAGIEYTLLDDYHFKQAGLEDDQLFGHFLSEDQGGLIKIFPISEPLRYLIPWKSPEEAVAYLQALHERKPDAVVVCADDGEKFGVWPETHRHVFTNGWLERFFSLLTTGGDWLRFCTLAEALDDTPSQGLVYLPDCSYREMTEWALPTERQRAYQQLLRELEGDHRAAAIKRFMRGGFYRNFRAKYPEAMEMYCRMLEVSRYLHEIAGDRERIDKARLELYRGQCNCAYWHGAFGGLYLPHLRHAVYHHLLLAENQARQAQAETLSLVEMDVADFNLDGQLEARVRNMHLAVYLQPSRGGTAYELDVLGVGRNLLASLSRRPEPYHETILRAAQGVRAESTVSQVVEEARFKQAGLEKLLQYDGYLRKSLVDHFYPLDATVVDLAGGTARELGDFVTNAYAMRTKHSNRAVNVVLQRQGLVDALPVHVAKIVGLETDSDCLHVRYVLEGLPEGRELLFAVEWNFAGLAAGEEDRQYHHDHAQRAGQLQTLQDVERVTHFGLRDDWLGIDVVLQFSRPTSVWAHPVQTVSQSEGGFELVYQSSAVVPHWLIRGDDDGRWEIAMELRVDVHRALSRRTS